MFRKLSFASAQIQSISHNMLKVSNIQMFVFPLTLQGNLPMATPRFSIFENLCRSAGFLQIFADMCRSADFFADLCRYVQIRKKLTYSEIQQKPHRDVK